MKRFVSIGECVIELRGKVDGSYRLGYAGETLEAALAARARLGTDWSIDYVTALGDDDQSQQLVDFLADLEIGIGGILKIAGRRPGLVLVDDTPDGPVATSWRSQSAARALADFPEALNGALAGAGMIYVSGSTLAILNARARGRLMKALHIARTAGAVIAFSPVEDENLWTSRRVMGSTLSAASIVADIVLAEPGGMFGDDTPEAVVRRYREGGATTVIAGRPGREMLVASGGAEERIAPASSGPPSRGTFDGQCLAAIMAGAPPAEAVRMALAAGAAEGRVSPV